jgi:glycosyltransferase involved in cell wall biosynthesis
MNKPVILHATTGLYQGGAERVLAMVATDPALADFRHVVYSLLGGGTVACELRRAGIQVLSADLSRSGGGVLNIASLIRAARSLRPVVIQGWMYHGNLLASTLGAFSHAPVVWSIHHTTLPARAPLKARVNMSLSAAISWVSPKRIVYCSDSAQRAHARRKFRGCGCVIPNGIDTQRYRPGLERRAGIRDHLRIPQESFVVGTVGRFDPLKDYLCLLRAAREWRRTGAARKMTVVLCGEGLCWENSVLVNWIRDFELTDDVILLGSREDVPDVLNALDVFTMSSRSEALPLALLEAMSSAVPCVVTDVGDCAAVVGRRDLTVPPEEPALLCRAWQEIEALSQTGRSEIGEQMRERVICQWGRDRMVGDYRRVYEDLIQPAALRHENALGASALLSIYSREPAGLGKAVKGTECK